LPAGPLFRSGRYPRPSALIRDRLSLLLFANCCSSGSVSSVLISGKPLLFSLRGHSFPITKYNYQEPVFPLPWLPSIRNLNHLAWDIPGHQCFCFCSWPIANCELLFALLLNTNYRSRYQLIFSLRVFSWSRSPCKDVTCCISCSRSKTFCLYGHQSGSSKMELN
jgi:hypothetical protein